MGCCDDLAIEICGDRDSYATALAELESRRTAAPVLGLAATDGPLLKRIRRILQVAGPDRIETPNWILTLALAAAFALLVGGPQRSTTLLAQATTSVAHALTPSFRAGWSEVTGSGSITSTGKVVFTDDLRDVRNVSDGGSLTVQSRRLSSSRRIEISASNGSVNRKYFVNDSEQPWNEESRRWFANELPFLVRRSSGASSLLFERWPRDPMILSPPSRNAGRAIDPDEPTSRTSSNFLKESFFYLFRRFDLRV